MRLKNIYTAIVFVILAMTGASAETVTAVASAGWSDASTWDTNKVPTKNDDVVIPEGIAVVVEAAVEMKNLEVYGTLTANAKVTVHGTMTVHSTGVINNEVGVVMSEGKCEMYGEICGKQRFVVKNDMVLGGTITFLTNANGVSKNVEVSGKLTLAGTTKISGLNAKSATCYFMYTAGGVELEEGAQLELYKCDAMFRMPNNTTIALNGTVIFKNNAASVKVCGADINKNGQNIVLKLGDNSEFISQNLSSNLFAYSNMLDWRDPNNYRHFTFTKGGNQFKLNLYDRPSGELTFYLHRADASNMISASVETSYAWTLVDEHCVYVNLPSKVSYPYSATTNKETAHYYPGINNSTYATAVDNAVVGAGKAFYLDCELRCLKSLTVDGTFKRNTGTSLICAETVTMLKENSIPNSDDVLSTEARVYVKTRPKTTMTLYSDKDGEWSDDDMWTYKASKHWYLLDKTAEGYVKYVPDNINDELVVRNAVTLDSDKKAKSIEITEGASLTVGCEQTLTVHDGVTVDAGGTFTVGDGCATATLEGDVNLCGELNGSGTITGEVKITEGCEETAHDNTSRLTWDDLEKDGDGCVEFWSVGLGDWKDYRNWSIVAPGTTGAEGALIYPKSVSGIYPGKDGQKDKIHVQYGHEMVATGLDLTGVYNLNIENNASVELSASTMTVENDLTIEGTLKGDGVVTIGELDILHKGGEANVTAEIDVKARPEGEVTFYSRKEGVASSWSNDRLWSLVDGANVFLSVDDAYYYPGKNAENVDNAVVSANSNITIDNNYTLKALTVEGTLAFTASRTLTANGAITINGAMTLTNGVRLTMAGEGHFAPSTGSITTVSGSSYMRCDWTLLAEALPYNEETGVCAFVNGEDDALAKYTSTSGSGTIELTSRPAKFSFAAYKKANWNDNKAWSVVAGKKIFLYLNDNFTNTIYPGEYGDGEADSFVIPEGITITHNLKVKSFENALIDGTLYLKDEVLYPNNGTDFDVVGGKRRAIIIGTLRGSGFINEEYDYTSKITDDSAYKASNGIYILRKLDGFTKFYSKNDTPWKTYTTWADKDNNAFVNRYPGSSNTQGDEAVVATKVTNYDVDVALSSLKISSSKGHLINSRSVRLVTNDVNLEIEEGGKYEVAGSSLMSFVGDGQNLVVNGEVIFDEGAIWSVVGNKDVIFGENGKFTGKGGIRISYENIIHGGPHYTFQSILDANPKLDAFLAQRGVMEMTARPNKGKPMDFYLQNDGDWNEKKQMWSIGDDAHSDKVDSENNYHVYVFDVEKQRYYYPGLSSESIDRVIICKGKSVNYTVAPDVTEMIVDGTLNVTKNQTMNIIGDDHALKVKSTGKINIMEGVTLTLSDDVKMTFEEGGTLTGLGTLVCYSAAIDYTVVDGVITFGPAVQKFIEDGGKLILMDRPASELTFYSDPTDGMAWNETATAHWSLVKGKKAYVRKYLFASGYYYPCSEHPDNVVLTSGTKMTIKQSYTIKNLEVCDNAEIKYLKVDGKLKLTINGKLILHESGKLVADDDMTQAYYIVSDYDCISFEGKDEDKENLRKLSTGEFINEQHTFVSNFSKHLSGGAKVWVSAHPESNINFFSKHDGENWKDVDRFTILPDAQVYLYIEGEYYYPGRLSYYTHDDVIIPEGKKVYVSDNIDDVKAIGDLHVDGELVMYNNSNRRGRTLKTLGVITGKGAIRCGTYYDKSILYVTSMDSEHWKFSGTNELLAEGFTLGCIYVTGDMANLTYYFSGTRSTAWNNWENWSLDENLRRVYAFIGGKNRYPAEALTTEIAVIPAGKDVKASSVLGDKALNGLVVNGTLDLYDRNLTLNKSFEGTGRIQSKYIDGIVCGEECSEKGFYAEGLMFVTTNPNVFYSYKWDDNAHDWGENVKSNMNWKVDTKYQDVNWTAVPCGKVFVRSERNEYSVPTSGDEVHITCGAKINALTSAKKDRNISRLYNEKGTLIINGGKVTVTQYYFFGAEGVIKYEGATDEWALPDVIEYETDCSIENTGGIMYLTENFANTQLSWPVAVMEFIGNGGKVLISGVDNQRKYYLKSGTQWSKAVWTIDKTIDKAGHLVAPNYPGQTLRDDQVVILKNNDDDPDVTLEHDVNIIVSDIEIRTGATLTSTYDMTVDNSVTGTGTLKVKSLTINEKDVVESPKQVTVDEAEKDAIFVGGKVILTGNKYAGAKLYAQAGETNWSAIKWSLRPDGNIYYINESQKPTSANDVVISHDIVVDEVATARSLTINEGVTVTINADLTVNGELRIYGDVVISEGKNLIVNGQIVEIADKAEGASRITGDGILKPFDSNATSEIRTKLDLFENLDKESTNRENVVYTHSKEYRTKAKGDWNAKIWQVKDGENWVDSEVYPTAIDVATIQNEVTVNGNYTVRNLYGTETAILSMKNLQQLNVIGEDHFFDADADGVGEIRLTIFDTSNAHIFYAQTSGNWKGIKWAIDPTRKIYSYRDKYDAPVLTVTDARNINVVINEGVELTVDFTDSKEIKTLVVNGTLKVNNNTTLTVQNMIEVGENGTLEIGTAENSDKSRVTAELYIKSQGVIKGNGELMVTEAHRIPYGEKTEILKTDNNGKVVVKHVDTPTTYYSIKNGAWEVTAKNDYVWSIERDKSVVNYSNSYNYYYAEPASISSIVVTSGTTVVLSGKSKNMANVTVEDGGVLQICGGTLNVTQKLDVKEGGRIELCEDGTGLLSTKNISGEGDIIMPLLNKLSITGNDEFAGHVGLTSISNVTYYYKNGSDCDCSADNADCQWENYTNWMIDPVRDYVYAYDLTKHKFVYPGEIEGHIYNVVVGNGKSVCLNEDIEKIDHLTIDGEVKVGEKELLDGTTTGFQHNPEKAILNVTEMDGTGLIELEYSDNLNVENYLMQAGRMVIRHFRQGETYYLLESGGTWTDWYNWTTDATASTRINPSKSYPGNTKKNDSAVIPSGRVVTMDKTTMLDNLTVDGEVLIKDPEIYMLVSNKANGEGKMLVQDINSSFIMVDPTKNTLFANGTITIGDACDVAAQNFGSLIIDSPEPVRLVGDINISDNLEIKSGAILTLGADINTGSIDVTTIRELARQGKGLPSVYDVFINVTVGGNVVVEENATLQAASYVKDARSVLNNIGGIPTWNVLNVGGSFTVDGTLNFATPDAATKSNYFTNELNNRAVVKFFGSKNSEFIVNSNAKMMRMVCDKDENATLYLNKTDDATFEMLSNFCLPDSNYTEYPIVLNSGVLRLGNHMKISAWGASRISTGVPVGMMQYDIYVPGSNIPIYHTIHWTNSEIYEAVRKSNESTWIDEFKNHLNKVKSFGLESEDQWYLNHDKKMHSFSAYKIIENDLKQGLVIPAKATLWIDGAEVEVGRGDETSNSVSNGKYIGHVALFGKLKITQGGKLILPSQSVGIVYDKPDEDVTTPASIYIEDGEIHTGRIYGLRGRKLDFNMEGGAIYFDRSTNDNSTLYNNEFFSSYGNGDMTMGKAQGCTFSMANGGDFNMSGGLIKFYNKDKAESFTITAIDLNNCGGQITGGTMEFADTTGVDNFNYSVYLGNHKLHNLTVTTRNSVVVHGNRSATDKTRGYKGHSLYINGDLTIVKNDDNRLLVPENLYIGGNMSIKQLGNKMPIFSSYGYYTKPAYAPNLIITGEGDTRMELIANSSSCVPIFNDLVINKTSSDYSFTIKGKPIYLLGNLEVNKGELITNTTKFSDYLDGVIMGNSSTQSYLSEQQSISVSASGSVVDATISIIKDSERDMKVLSDVVVKNFYSGVERRVALGGYNFKVLDELKMSARSEKSMFVCTDENANGGLTLKATLAAGGVIEMPVGISYTNKSKGTGYAYTRCKATAATDIDGYLTAIPCSNYHPSITKTDNATKFYWRMKWEGTEGDHILSYNFRLPGIDQENAEPKETKTKRCNVENCTDNMHGAEKETLANYWLYTHYYQYYDLKWNECDKMILDQKYGDGVPNFAADKMVNPNGDFTDGYHFDVVNGPKTYYSVQSGEWNSKATWSLDKDKTVKPDALPSVADKVVIRNGHSITTSSTESIKAAQIEFVASKNVYYTSTLTVAKSTKKNSVASIIGEGKLIYDVDNSQDWSIDSRLKEVNFLMGDHSQFCDNSSSTIEFINSDAEKDFNLPSRIVTYPNLVTKGRVNVGGASAPNGLEIKGNLVVESGTLTLGCGDGRKNIVDGKIQVKSGAVLNVNKDLTVSANVENSGTLNINSGTTEVITNVTQSGAMSVGNATLAFVGDKASTLKGNTLKWTEGSVLKVSKDVASLVTYLETKFDASGIEGNIINATLTRGKVYFNTQNEVKIASYANGSRLSTFDIPNTLTLDVESGKLTLYGTDQQSTKLDGELIVANSATFTTTNGLGYSSGGTAKLTLDGSAKFLASQLAPSGESGKLDFAMKSSTVNVLLGDDPAALYDTRYGRLDIRGGSFTQAKNTVINIKAAANANVPTLYYAPTNSNINESSSIVINIPDTQDPENPQTTAYVYAEKDLQGMTIGNYTIVSVKSRPLTFNSTLNINGTLMTNGYDMTFNGGVTINGKYMHGDNTTILNGTSAQTISGSASDVEFYSLEKNSDVHTQINLSNPTVTKTLKVSDGTLSMLNSPLKFIGTEMFVNYGHSVGGKGVSFEGATQQNLYCEGEISNLIVNNPSGVNAATMQSHPITISSGLTLTSGILRIGANQLILDKNANVVNGNPEEPFGTSKMISTNVSLADMGVRKLVATSSNKTILLPVGYGDIYSPVTIDITSLTSTNGYFDVKPINGYYMGVNNQKLETDNTPIKEHILDFNWYIASEGVSGYKGTITFDANGVHAYGYTHTHLIENENKGYVVAAYFDGRTECDKAHQNSSITSVDPNNDAKIVFPFVGGENEPISGYYTAGCYNALPQYPQAYISVADGVWDGETEKAIWKKYDMENSSVIEGDPISLTSAEIYGSNVIIANDVTIATDGLRLSSVRINEGGTLKVGTTRSHYFGVVSGKGTLQMESGNMPAANYDAFLDATNGGTLEFTGSGDYYILHSFTQVRNLKLTGSGKRTFMSARNVNLDINGLYVIDGPVVDSDADIRVHGNMDVVNGNFTGTGTYIFCGTSGKQTIDVHGDNLSLSGLQLDNADGMSVNKPLSLTKRLILTKGILEADEVTLTNYNATISGNSTSYIEGWLYREMNTGSRYEYYIGDKNLSSNERRYGRCAIEVTSRGIWGARFHNNAIIDEENEIYATNANHVNLSLGKEYWEVKRASASGKAYVTVSWDDKSIYNGTQSTYQAYYTNEFEEGTSSVWSEANTTAKSGSTTAGEATLKNGTSGFDTNGASCFFALGKKVVEASVWKGGNNDWFNRNNWEGGTLPNSERDVYIDVNSTMSAPIITDNGTGRIAHANTIWIYGTDSHLTVKDGGKLICNGSIIIEDKDNCHVTICHERKKTSTLKLVGGYFETIKGGHRSKENDYHNVRVEYTTQVGRSNYMGSATEEGTVDAEGMILKIYDIVSDKYVTSSSFPANFAGAGSIAHRGSLDDDWTFTQTGTVRSSGSVSMTVKSSKWSSDGQYKWPLLSNPFTFSFPLGVQDAISYTDNIDPVIWFRSFDDDLRQFFFSTYNMHTRIGVASGSGKKENDPYMAPQQSFFVRPTTDMDGSITLNAEKVDGIHSTSLKSAEVPANDVLRFVIGSEGQNFDEMAMVFRAGGSLDRVYGDAEKMSLKTTQNQISSVKDGAYFSIPFYPAASNVNDVVLPLFVSLSSQSTAGSIKATNLVDFDDEYDVYFYDFALDTVVNLRDYEVYDFTLADGDVSDRFAVSLHYVERHVDNEDGSQTTDVESISSDANITIYKNDDNYATVLVSPSLVGNNTVINVYDIWGRVVSSLKANSMRTRIALGEQKGVYVVEVVSGYTTKSVKVVK